MGSWLAEKGHVVEAWRLAVVRSENPRGFVAGLPNGGFCHGQRVHVFGSGACFRFRRKEKRKLIFTKHFCVAYRLLSHFTALKIEALRD